MKGKLKYVIGGFIALVLIAGITAGSGSDTSTSNSSPTASESSQSTEQAARFTDRADVQPEDVEIIVGESATLDGVKLSVDSVQYKKSITDFEQADSVIYRTFF